MSDPTEYTVDEARSLFIEKLRNNVDYWDKVDAKTKKEALEGVTHSFLALLDGSAVDFPAFSLIPDVPEGDVAFSINHGERWFPNEDINNGNLAVLYYQSDKDKDKELMRLHLSAFSKKLNDTFK